MGCVPGKLGRPRQKSKYKLNANDKTLMFSDFEAAVEAAPVAPVALVAPVAPVLVAPMAFGIAR